MPFQCIGQFYVKVKGGSNQLVRCTETSETPTDAAHPSWGWLCEHCANSPARPAPAHKEPENLIAMQVDPEEYRELAENILLGTKGDD